MSAALPHFLQHAERERADVLPFLSLLGASLTSARATCRAFTGAAFFFLTGGGQSGKIARLRSFVEHVFSSDLLTVSNYRVIIWKTHNSHVSAK